MLAVNILAIINNEVVVSWALRNQRAAHLHQVTLHFGINGQGVIPVKAVISIYAAIVVDDSRAGGEVALLINGIAAWHKGNGGAPRAHIIAAADGAHVCLVGVCSSQSRQRVCRIVLDRGCRSAVRTGFVRSINRDIRHIEFPVCLVAAGRPRQRGAVGSHIGSSQGRRDGTSGYLVHRNVVNMHVIVAVATHSGFTIERYPNGLACILAQRNGYSFARRTDVVIDIVTADIVPNRSIAHAPGGTVVGGDEDDEPVIRLGSGTTHWVRTIERGQGQIKGQFRIGQSGDVNGRCHQPMFYCCSINVKFGVSLSKHILIVENPTTVEGR